MLAPAANAQIRIGGRSINLDRALQAGSDILTAATLSDAQVKELCREAVVYMDEENTLAGSDTEYGQRLERLTGDLANYDGLDLNFKVYKTEDVNAFACGDGSVRVYSGLMDVMTDNELMAIIGHEIGHIKNTDTKDAMKKAYEISAARNVVGAAGGKIGALSDSQLGSLTEVFFNSKYSRDQENAADDYGFRFSVDNGRDPYAMALSLEKLLSLSGKSSSSAIQQGISQAFSSHPDTKVRVARMRAQADEYMKTKR